MRGLNPDHVFKDFSRLPRRADRICRIPRSVEKEYKPQAEASGCLVVLCRCLRGRLVTARYREPRHCHPILEGSFRALSRPGGTPMLNLSSSKPAAASIRVPPETPVSTCTSQASCPELPCIPVVQCDWARRRSLSFPAPTCRLSQCKKGSGNHPLNPKTRNTLHWALLGLKSWR